MKIIIPNLFDGRERRGYCDEAAARQAGRREGGMGNGKDTDTARNVLYGSQDLVQTPSLNKSASQDTGHSVATATPRGNKSLSKTFISRLISPPQIRRILKPGGDFCRKETERKTSPPPPQTTGRPGEPIRGPIPRDHRLFATVARPTGWFTSNWPNKGHAKPLKFLHTLTIRGMFEAVILQVLTNAPSD